MLDVKLTTGIAAAAVAAVASIIYSQTRASSEQPSTASDAKTRDSEEEKASTSESIMPPPMFDLDPPKDDMFTVEQLKLYDGSREDRPVFVAIKGTVFDVTRKRDVYGAGKSYNVFAGKDGSRGLGMSSLHPQDAVADYSTLEDRELQTLDQWYKFFSERYNVMGHLAASPAS